MTDPVKTFSVAIAERSSRRRFLGRSATGLFGTVAALAAGSLIDPKQAFAYPSACESPIGQGCPFGCGPDRCCGSQSGDCLCGTNANCANNGVDCHGYVGGSDWGGASCWTCVWTGCESVYFYQYTTTCCDCATTNCDIHNICISWKTTKTAIGCCGGVAGGPPTLFAKPVVVGVSTGDPATSWGDTTRAFPGTPPAARKGPEPAIPAC